jgi:hypothetical protein
MKRAITFSILLSILGCFIGCVSEQRECERDLILSLPWQQFDQTPNSGWRIYFARHDYRAAADLIEIYLKQHQNLTVRQRAVSNFHAGQMRLHVGGPQAAIPHMRLALVPENTPGLSDDWNIMVLAHIAFLNDDRAALDALKAQQAVLPPSRVEWPGCAANLLDHLGQSYEFLWK